MIGTLLYDIEFAVVAYHFRLSVHLFHSLHVAPRPPQHLFFSLSLAHFLSFARPLSLFRPFPDYLVLARSLPISIFSSPFRSCLIARSPPLLSFAGSSSCTRYPLFLIVHAWHCHFVCVYVLHLHMLIRFMIFQMCASSKLRSVHIMLSPIN